MKAKLLLVLITNGIVWGIATTGDLSGVSRDIEITARYIVPSFVTLFSVSIALYAIRKERKNNHES